MLTLRELKQLVDTPLKGEKKPSFGKLQKGISPIVVQERISSDSNPVIITAYKNGYISYEIANHFTVFPITDVSAYAYSSVAGNPYGCELDASYFEDANWYLLFALCGEDRIDKNFKFQRSKHCISFTSIMEEVENGGENSWDMEEEIVQQEAMKSMLDSLTEKQKDLICALYFNNQTYSEYAKEQGITSPAVAKVRRQAITRLATWLEDAKKNLETKK